MKNCKSSTCLQINPQPFEEFYNTNRFKDSAVILHNALEYIKRHQLGV